jgi:hypothetical protein
MVPRVRSKGLTETSARPPIDAKRASDHMVRMVDVVFGLVFAQGLLLFRAVLVDPFHSKYIVVLTGLVCVYYTTIRSWIDWHITMERNPYDVWQSESTTSFPETVRIYLDFAIVSVYAFLLFQLLTHVTNQDASLTGYLVGFVLIFVLYLGSGVLRRYTHGPKASSLVPIARFLAIFFVFTAAYHYTYYHIDLLATHKAALNEFAVLATFAGMLGYRRYRTWWRKRQT